LLAVFAPNRLLFAVMPAEAMIESENLTKRFGELE
jgi:hypothetical protein